MIKDPQTVHREEVEAQLSKLQGQMEDLKKGRAVQETDEERHFAEQMEKIQQRKEALQKELAATGTSHEAWDRTKDVVHTTREEIKLAFADLDNWVRTGKHS